MVTHSMENILGMQYYVPPVDEPVHSPPRKKRCMAKEQDPMSHRIIEKRRRDRMNNCLADLSRLIPAEYLKKGRGRVEKTEIIEMAIRHMKHLQGLRQDSKHHTPAPSVHTVHGEDSVDSSMSHSPSGGPSATEHYRLGYQECLSEALHFLIEVEGFFARDALCVQLIQHLQQHCDKIIAASDRLGFPHPVDLPNINSSNCSGGNVTSFAHAVNDGLSCPNNLTSNGLTGINNNNNNNNGLHANQNHQSNGGSSHHQSILNSCSNSSDRCSSSGVSSFDQSESRASQRPQLIPLPSFTSDDSNHSSHSGGGGSSSISNMQLSGSGIISGANSSHHHHHDNYLNQHAYNTHHHHHQDTGHPRPAMTNYKFKNSIKQRFSADQRIKTCSSPTPPPSISGSSSESSPKQQSNHGIPIFALHDNGGFYVPLTVEASLLRPHVGATTSDLGPEAVLHPVTISVNFSHPSQTVWSHHQHSPPHQMQ